MNFPSEIEKLIKEFSRPGRLLYPTILNKINYFRDDNKMFLNFENGKMFYSNYTNKLTLVNNNYFIPELEITIDKLHKIVNEDSIYIIQKHKYYFHFEFSFEIIIKRCGRYLMFIYYHPEQSSYEPEDKDEDIKDIGGHHIFVPIYLIIGIINNIDIDMNKFIIDTTIEDILKGNPDENDIIKSHLHYVKIKKEERKQFSNIKYKIF